MSDPRYYPKDGDITGMCDHVIQECAELIVAVTKLKLFGQHAQDPYTGIVYNNAADVISEHADVDMAMTRLVKHLQP